MDTYFAVFRVDERYVKIRVTYAPKSGVDAMIETFVRQMLSALAFRGPVCPTPLP
jgi:hypothetical protein